jgi:copper chaperone NosL
LKKLIPLLIVLLLIVGIVTIFTSLANVQRMTVVYEGNTTKLPIEIEFNHFQDSECGMIIDDITYASQVIASDGKTWFFHDHGGMASWLFLKTERFQNEAVIWVWAKDSTRWIDGKMAWYSRNDITPMAYGFGAYMSKRARFVSFNDMQGYMERGETLANLDKRKQIMDELNGNR